MDNDLPNLYEPEERQSISVNGENMRFDYIPTLVREEGKPVDMVVYAVLVDYAKREGGEWAELPPRDHFSKMCGISQRTLAESLERLNQAGFITILPDNGKKTRRRIIVKWWSPVARLVNELRAAELTEKAIAAIVEKTINAALGRGATLHNIYSPEKPLNDEKGGGLFPPQLHAFKAAAKKQDSTGKTLSNYSDQSLLDYSGGADYQHIEIAIREIETYPNTIKSIIAFYRARFKDGKLNPARPGYQHGRKPVEEKKPEPRKTPTGNIRRTQDFTGGDLNVTCNLLSQGDSIEMVEMPQYVWDEKYKLDQYFVTDRERGPYWRKLHDNAELYMVSYEEQSWRIAWRVKLSDSSRATGQARPLSDSMNAAISSVRS